MYNKTTPAAATRAPQPSIIQAIVRPILLMTTDPLYLAASALQDRREINRQPQPVAANSGSLAKFTVMRQPFNDLVIDCDDVATIMMRGYKIVIPPIGGATRRGGSRRTSKKLPNILGETKMVEEISEDFIKPGHHFDTGPFLLDLYRSSQCTSETSSWQRWRSNPPS